MTSTDFKTFNIVPVARSPVGRGRSRGKAVVVRGTVKISAEEQIDSRSQKISSVLCPLPRFVPCPAEGEVYCRLQGDLSDSTQWEMQYDAMGLLVFLDPCLRFWSITSKTNCVSLWEFLNLRNGDL